MRDEVENGQMSNRGMNRGMRSNNQDMTESYYKNQGKFYGMGNGSQSAMVSNRKRPMGGMSGGNMDMTESYYNNQGKFYGANNNTQRRRGLMGGQPTDSFYKAEGNFYGVDKGKGR